jgi:hypothetical protein
MEVQHILNRNAFPPNGHLSMKHFDSFVFDKKTYERELAEFEQLLNASTTPLLLFLKNIPTH